MHLIQSCRRCGSDMERQDLFCQECGLDKSPQAMSDSFSGGISDYDWPALGPDPLLETQESPGITNLFGQTYDFSNYQLDLGGSSFQAEAATESIGVVGTELNEPVETLDFSPESQLEISSDKPKTDEPKLHSPLLKSQSDEPANDKLGMRGGWAMVFIDSFVVITVVASMIALLIFFYSNHKKDSLRAQKASQDKLATTVQKAATQEDHKTVYKHLLASRILGQLDEKKQVLFDEAAFRLGQKEMQDANIDKAIEYFSQVSIESQHYIRAQELIFQHASPAVTVAKPPLSDARSERKRKRVESPTRTAPLKLSAEPVLSIPVIEEIENKKAETESASSGQASNQNEVSTRKFSEAEISEYNQLLGNYFAKKKERKEDSGTATAEAPSFREWIREGKPSF